MEAFLRYALKKPGVFAGIRKFKKAVQNPKAGKKLSSQDAYTLTQAELKAVSEKENNCIGSKTANAI